MEHIGQYPISGIRRLPFHMYHAFGHEHDLDTLLELERMVVHVVIQNTAHAIMPNAIVPMCSQDPFEPFKEQRSKYRKTH
jgi:hypothetical protein